jgi:hypothetical protein
MPPSFFSLAGLWRAGCRRLRRLRIRAVWFGRDLRQSRQQAPAFLECPVCLGRGANETYKILVSRCIFGGGALVRHECPRCGVIFGPQKMLVLSPRELDSDYRAHYSCFSEGDTSEAVLETFRQLDPRPGGLYLNYGCGLWSKAMTKIRAEGNDIVGFDPYVADAEDPRMIHDIGLLGGMRFDGIMSHNLLEHLADPRSALAFMASLLKKDGIMAHSTECFEYRHEYSRFHLFFFTGNSLQPLLENAGLRCAGVPAKYIRIFKPFRALR